MGRVCGLVCLLVVVLSSFLPAQNYLLSTGAPTFLTAEPVELGYINLSNGNLHLSVAFGNFPQRGAIPFSAGMVYDSRIWQVVNNAWQPTNVANSQGGWRYASSVDAGSVTYTTVTTDCGGNNLITNQNFVWTQPNGTQRFFPIQTSQNLCTGQNVTSGNAFAQDSTGLHMYLTNYTSATIFAKNGIRLFPTAQDTNGNYFTFDGNGNAVDTLGRTPVTKTVVGSVTNFDVLNSQGTTSRYIVTTAPIVVSTNFGQSGVTEYSGSLTIVQSIALPDGSSYSFGYDGYGEVNSVTLRTGGTITYAYTNFSDSYGNINRWVNQRTSAGGTWNYAPAVITTCGSGQVGCQEKVTVSKPSGDDSVYTFTLNNGAWNVQLQGYTGSAATGALLKTIATDFDFTNACPLVGCTGNGYIRPTRVTTTDPIPGSSINKKIEYSYDSIYYGNVNVKKEWLYYSGTPAANPDRETDTTFLTTSSYVPKDILDRPTDIVTKDASATQKAETKYSYDSTTLTSQTGDAHHDDANFGTGNTVRGNVTQILRWVRDAGCTPNTVTCLSTSQTFSTEGNRLSVTDPKGNQTTYSYVDTNNFFNDDGSFSPPAVTPAPPVHAYLHKITYPNSETYTYQYYFGSGQVGIEIDENAKNAYHHYIDPLDRITLDYTPEITTNNRPWKIFAYPSSAPFTQTDIYTGITSATPSTSCTFCRHDTTTYDTNGRLSRNTLVSDPDGQTFTDTAYDTTSRTSSVSNPYRSTSDPTYGLESFLYDGLDRQTRNTHQDNNYTQTVYGAAVSGSGGAAAQLCASGTYGLGYPTLTVDEAGKKMQNWVDGFGRNIESDEPDSSGNLTVGTCYQYDALNNLTDVAQGDRYPRHYEYDGLSRQTLARDGESGTTATAYTASPSTLCSGVASNACGITDARNITTTFAYDSRNRLTSKTYSDSTHSVTYVYGNGACNGITPTNGINRRTCMTDASGTTAWSYDPAGYIITEKRTVGSITKTISNTYNLDGSVATKTYPATAGGSGNVITYTYNNAQRLTALENNVIHVHYATTITYAPHGAIASMLENPVSGGFAGITYTRSYNNRLQLTANRATSSNGTALDLAYAYDQGGGVNNGNLVTLTNNRDTTRSASYTYDTLNRVSTAQTSTTSGSFCWGFSFGYDAYGNLLSQSALTAFQQTCTNLTFKNSLFNLGVDANNHIGGDTYDSAGNLTHDALSSLSFAYDAENRMTTGNTITYTHDGDNWRVKKSNGDLEWHDRTCDGNLLDVFDLSGNLKAEYYYVGSMLFASRSLYYFGDNVNSIRVITDVTGDLPVQRESDYYPFGQELPVVTTLSDARKFNSKKRDTETNLDYAHLRMSNSSLGRWNSTDPFEGDAERPQSLNRYAYVQNMPVVNTDPTGGFFQPNSVRDDSWGGSVDVNDTVDPVDDATSGRGPGSGWSPLAGLIWPQRHTRDRDPRPKRKAPRRRIGPPKPPKPQPRRPGLPDNVKSDCAAYKRCLGPDFPDFSGTSRPHVPPQNWHTGRDDFGNGAFPQGDFGDFRAIGTAERERGCLRDHPLAALDPSCGAGLPGHDF